MAGDGEIHCLQCQPEGGVTHQEHNCYYASLHDNKLCMHVSYVLLEYFAGEKPLRMSQISRKFDSLRSNYCVLARIVCIYSSRFRGFYCYELINPRKVRKCLMLAKHSSNMVRSNIAHDTFY